MEFKEFVQKLYPIIGSKLTQAEFVRTIFEEITTEEAQSILDGYSPSTFRSFFNGNQNIKGIVKKILKFIDSSAFAAYINTFSDDLVLLLVEHFSPFIESLDAFNLDTKLADYFTQILQASIKTNNTSPHEEKINISSSNHKKTEHDYENKAQSNTLIINQSGNNNIITNYIDLIIL